MKLPYQDTDVAKEVAKCMSASFIEQHSNQKNKTTEKRNEVVEIQLHFG